MGAHCRLPTGKAPPALGVWAHLHVHAKTLLLLVIMMVVMVTMVTMMMVATGMMVMVIFGDVGDSDGGDGGDDGDEFIPGWLAAGPLMARKTRRHTLLGPTSAGGVPLCWKVWCK